MINKKQLKSKLPHGAMTRIAERANVSKQTVTYFFNDKIKSSPKIEKAALEVAMEYKNSIAGMAEELNCL